MRILLINPPITFNSKRCLTHEPPLGILYIASILKRKHEVKFIDIDCDRYKKQDVAKILSKFRPNAVGITCNIVQVIGTYEVAKIVKEYDPKITVVVGGSGATVMFKEMLQKKVIDIVVLGEGEITTDELFDALDLKNKTLAEIPGIAFWDGNHVHLTQKRPFIEDLDQIPFPSHEINEPLNRYASFPIMPVLPSRGCPYSCLFCSNPVWGKSNRRRSPFNIIDEIEMLLENYKIEEVDFHDDIFNLDVKFVNELCDLIMERNLHKKIRWRAECRVNENLVSEELFQKMREAGCWLVSFGIESGNEQILKNIRKGITLNEVRRAVKIAKQCGIKIRGFFMIGNLGETYKTVFDTILFAKELDLDSYQFTFVTPYPGSIYYEIAKKNNWIAHSNYYLYDENTPIVNTPELSLDDLEKLKEVAKIINPGKGVYLLGRSKQTKGNIRGFIIRLFKKIIPLSLRRIIRDFLFYE